MTEPPGATSRSHHRRVRWLELFFDLAFVAFASQLSHTLHGNPDFLDFTLFLALFFPPWWLWISYTVSSNIVEDDSPKRRLIMLAAMTCLVFMAAAVPMASSSTGAAYALGYAGTRFLLLGMWWPATRATSPLRVPKWQPLVYCLSFGSLWATSAFVPEPWRYLLWISLMVAEVTLVLFDQGGRITKRLHIGHLVERVGLFVIIMLGESILSLVKSMGVSWSFTSGVVAGVGFVLLASLWWSYFDFGSASLETVLGASGGRSSYPLARDVTGLLHFFVTAAVMCIAAGLATAVEESEHAHLPGGAVIALAGGLALYHLAHAGIALRIGIPLKKVAPWVLPGVAIPVLIIAFNEHFSPSMVVLILAAESILHLLYAQYSVRKNRVVEP
ncbi:low temperature requirement protein A [Streptomyces sp. IBSNAI002]|uniref:low temperature requirement protein A n=1 Tax=Streptomyces sp. IBSNAI002 TaxID=3457500 RepID=UPI003FD0A60C